MIKLLFISCVLISFIILQLTLTRVGVVWTKSSTWTKQAKSPCTCLAMPSISSQTQERNAVRSSMSGEWNYYLAQEPNLMGVAIITQTGMDIQPRARTTGTCLITCSKRTLVFVFHAQGVLREARSLRFEQLYGQFWYSSCRFGWVVCGVLCKHLRPRLYWFIDHLWWSRGG